MTKARMFSSHIFFALLFSSFLTACEDRAYECLDDGGIMTSEGNCSCDAYGDVGQCLSFTQKKILTDENGSELSFQSAGTLRGMQIDGEALDVKIVESEQGISFYSYDPKIAIFLPRTLAINSADFLENECRFTFNRKQLSEPKYEKVAGKSYQIESPIELSVESLCNQSPTNSYTINGALGLLDVELSDGRHFRIMEQE